MVLRYWTNETAPPPVLVALNVETVFAFANAVPPTEEVVNVAPLMVPAAASLTTPFVPVKFTLPVVLMLPAFKVTLAPAVKLITPEPLVMLELTRILPVPELTKVTALLPVV